VAKTRVAGPVGAAAVLVVVTVGNRYRRSMHSMSDRSPRDAIDEVSEKAKFFFSYPID